MGDRQAVYVVFYMAEQARGFRIHSIRQTGIWELSFHWFLFWRP
jgi:hypothetical protein